MRENRVHENVLSHNVPIQHICGKKNLADLFTKKMRDTSHFVELRDLMIFFIYLLSCLAFEGGVGIVSNTVTVTQLDRLITLIIFELGFSCFLLSYQ
jgi:hypothetical protein